MGGLKSEVQLEKLAMNQFAILYEKRFLPRA